MTQALTASPFAANTDDDVPWTIWQRKDSVLNLLEEKDTDRRSIIERAEPSIPPCNAVSAPISINRQQYHSVLNRMSQASGKAGAFSSWNPANT